MDHDPILDSLRARIAEKKRRGVPCSSATPHVQLGQGDGPQPAVMEETTEAAPPTASSGQEAVPEKWPETAPKLEVLDGMAAGAHAVQLRGSGRRVSSASWAAYRSWQARGDVSTLWHSAFAFPNQPLSTAPKNILCNQSIKAAIKYLCPIYCPNGDCVLDLCILRVQQQRLAFIAACSTQSKTPTQLLDQMLRPVFDRNTGNYGLVNVSFELGVSAKICIHGVAVLYGCTAAMFKRTKKAIESNLEAPAAALIPFGTSHVEAASLKKCHMRAYIRTLLDKGEQQPTGSSSAKVLGACVRDRETVLNKRSWKEKYGDYVKAMRNQSTGDSNSVLISCMKLFEVTWKEETRLKEKKALSNAKCDTCKQLDVLLAELRGQNGEEAKEKRANCQRAMREHIAQMHNERTVLDDAGLVAITKPRDKWTFIVDAATQKNFEIPKFLGRRHKSLAKCDLFKMKLMAVYSYGYGFTPFLIHDSQTTGANATWTCLWLVICRMFERYGFWPAEMHIQLDNTIGDCKNMTTWAMACWLVATRRCRRVHVFFLDVGHTHVIIDQIFGVVTKGLVGNEFLFVEDLMANIDDTLAGIPDYQAHRVERLHCLFDFTSWAKDSMGLHPFGRATGQSRTDTSENGTFKSMHDFMVGSGGPGEMPRMQYRGYSTDMWQPSTGRGALIIKSVPESPPKLARLSPTPGWKTELMCTMAKYVKVSVAANQMGASAFLKRWQAELDRVPTIVELLDPDLQMQFPLFNPSTCSCRALPKTVLRPLPAAKKAQSYGTGSGPESLGSTPAKTLLKWRTTRWSVPNSRRRSSRPRRAPILPPFATAKFRRRRTLHASSPVTSSLRRTILVELTCGRWATWDTALAALRVTCLRIARTTRRR
jgi:hypothetical protein